MNTTFEQAQELRNNGKIDEAITLYEEVRNNALASNDKKLAAECLHMVGVAQYQNERYSEADATYEKAQEEFEQNGLDEWVGFVLRDRGINARAQKKLDDAEQFLQQSIERLHQTMNKAHEGMSLVRLGCVYGDKGDFQKAISTIERGIHLIEETDDKFFLSTAYFDLAKVDDASGKTNEAREYAKKSLEVLNSFSNESKFQKRRKDIEEFLQKYKR